MMITEITSVPDEVLPLDLLRDHLRLGTGFDETNLQDDLLRTYLRSAISAIEARTGKVILERTFSWVLFEWRDVQRQPLPLAPVRAVPQIILEAADGSENVLTDGWRLHPDVQRPVIVADGTALPSIPPRGEARIHMVSGFSADWSGVPDGLKQAVLMLAAYFYENRFASQTSAEPFPKGVNDLIEPFRTVRLFLGSRA